MTSQEYLDKFIVDVNNALDAGKKGYYLMRVKIAKSTANLIKEYLENHPEYRFDVKPSCNCTNTWNVTVIFVNQKLTQNT